MSDQRISDTETVREDKLEAVSLTESSKTLRKLDNFWYHYKWTVIVVTFFVTVGIICFVQFFSRPKYDTSIAIATSYRMKEDEYEAFEALVEELLPDDFDGNKKKNVNVIMYQYYSPAEIEQERAEAALRETDAFIINQQYNNSELGAFTNLTMTGETSVCVVSPDIYAQLIEKKRLLPISDLYGADTLPAGVRDDGRGIDLQKTDLYKYNPAMQVLPENSILCILYPSVSGHSSHEENYKQEQLFFRALADFDVEDGE